MHVAGVTMRVDMHANSLYFGVSQLLSLLRSVCGEFSLLVLHKVPVNVSCALQGRRMMER